MDHLILQKAFHFDETDLEENRKGRLSGKQKQGLQRNYAADKKSFLKVGLILLGIALVFLVLCIVLFKFISFGVLALGVFMLFFGAASAYNLRKAASMNSGEILDGLLKKVEGPIRMVNTRTYDDVSLRIGGKTFAITDGMADKLIAGDVYCIYYVEENNRILSMEWIAKQ